MTGLARQQHQLAGGLTDASAALEGATATARQAVLDLATVRSQLPQAQAAAVAARARLDGAQALAASAAREVGTARTAVGQAAAAAAAARGRLAARRSEADRLARAAYESGPITEVQTYLAASNPGDLADRAELLRFAGRSTRRQLLDLAGGAADVAVQERLAADAARALAGRQAAAAAATTGARRAAAATDAAVASVAALVATRAGALSTAQAQEAQDHSRLATLQGESDRVGVLLATAQAQQARQARQAAVARAAASASAAAAIASASAAAAASAARRPGPVVPVPPPVPIGPPAPVAAGTGLLWPTAGPQTSGFGYRVDPVTGERSLHAGIDIGAPIGQSIVAAEAGTVVFAGEETGYGNYTCIDHGGGFATCYAHQSAILVTVGQPVARGEVIGRVGSTGYSTGPHLHFETRVNGTPVDPDGYSYAGR